MFCPDLEVSVIVRAGELMFNGKQRQAEGKHSHSALMLVCLARQDTQTDMGSPDGVTFVRADSGQEN